MVAKIITGKKIAGALYYNEEKVSKGEARLLMAAHYPKDKDELSFADKLNRLQNLAALNTRVRTNCFHVSLNFDPSEKLSDETLRGIAETYMQKIGFGDQPYLVYQHNDAGHAHIHILSTNIKKDGNRIEMHNIGKTRSEKARKEIERRFGLVPAEGRSKSRVQAAKPQVVHYGKTETKKAIAAVVSEVVDGYSYASLSELNTILRQFNIEASRGPQDSPMYRNGGLHYSVLDKEGSKIGVPIKASTLLGKPTLKSLEKRFATGGAEKKANRERLTRVLDKVLRQGIDRRQLQEILKAAGISIQLHENKQGFLYGVSYVDNVTRCAFKGSELGKAYSARSIAALLEERPQRPTTTDIADPPQPKILVAESTERKVLHFDMEGDRGDAAEANLPFELRRTKKKKKKKRFNH